MSRDSEAAVKLSDAYAVRSPEDNRDLYRRWAETYDTEFAEGHGYAYHHNIAQAYVDAGGALGNVLDVGCGTGLVGVALRQRGVGEIHGVDISPDMLDQAKAKVDPDGAPVYASLSEADLTRSVAIDADSYAGVISAGAFTHGHIGPEGLDEVLRMARSGALLAIGVNADLFAQEGGFGSWLTAGEADGRITGARLEEIDVYQVGLGAVGAQNLASGNAKANVMLFLKA